MEIPFLDLRRFDASLKESLREKFDKMLDEGVFSGGREISDFEARVQVKLQSAHGIACANGTDVLELGLRGLGVAPGDEVIVPALTWVSTAEAVQMVGAKPVFWDTDADGLLAADWENAISPRTKVVIPVHLYGKMVQMNQLSQQAKSNSIFVMEDAAQSFGAFQEERAAGTWGEVGCLSFYPTKNLGALGEAGMCLTQDADLANRIRLLLNHGQKVRDTHVLVGRNSRMDSLQAGFLNVLMNRFDAFQTKRKLLAKNYLENLSQIAELSLPNGILNSDHNAHLFVIQTERRDGLRDFLRNKGIGTAIHYPKIIPEIGLFESKGNFPNALKIAKNGLSIPLNPFLEEIEQEYIIDQIQHFFKN